jgi:hypothetical protein
MLIAVPYGAPFAYKTANHRHGAAVGQNGLFQHIFPADDADLGVVHLHPVDERAEVSLAEGDLAGGQPLAHGFAEPLDDDGADVHGRAHRRACPLQGGAGGVAVSADGTKLAVTNVQGLIQTSTNSGASWTVRYVNGSSGAEGWVAGPGDWSAIASSADGTKLAAVADGGQIFTSSNSGAAWTARESNRNWKSIASSSDGTKLAAAASSGQIYTSTDGGVTWTARASSRAWQGIASSADGTKLAAVVDGGLIHTSTDSGVTWTAKASARQWRGITLSADGTKAAAVAWNGRIYTSTTCTPP